MSVKKVLGIESEIETNFEQSEVHITLVSTNGGSLTAEMIVEAVKDLVEDLSTGESGEIH